MTGLGRVGPLRPDLRPCPWPGCPRRVPPRYLLCPRHWCRLPEAVRQRINDTYRPGQTLASASPEYLEALEDALEFARQAAADAHDQLGREIERGEVTGMGKGKDADVKLTGKDPGGKLDKILGRGSDPKNK